VYRNPGRGRSKCSLLEDVARGRPVRIEAGRCGIHRRMSSKWIARRERRQAFGYVKVEDGRRR
jgi:hypothetical protein